MNLCAFCGHPEEQHQPADGYKQRSCRAVVCEDKKANRGRCAIFTSKAYQAEQDAALKAYEEPQTVMPADVADRLHSAAYGEGSTHSLYLSCPCAKQARWLLGIDKTI